MSLSLKFSFTAAVVLILIWLSLTLFAGLDILAAYLLAANFSCFALCAWDKTLAQRAQMRIPEKVLLSWSLLGGTPGMLLGMVLFRHKTQKAKFQYGLVFILTIQILLLYLSGLH